MKTSQEEKQRDWKSESQEPVFDRQVGNAREMFYISTDYYEPVAQSNRCYHDVFDTYGPSY